MRKTLLLLLLIAASVSGVKAQGVSVTGKITSASDGKALPGVNVIVKGSSTGTTSDMDGNYKIAVPGANSTLVYSFIGMRTKEVLVGNQSVINVGMQLDNLNLNEVVITALGVKKEKRALSYAVQDIKGEDLNRGNNTNAISALSGKVAGVQVVNSSGTPGASAYIRLRGSRSIEGENQPLFVVDGVPMNNDQNLGGDPANGDNNLLDGVSQSNRLIDINPDDIESMSFLKGGAATALYGVNGGNGVVLITTKRAGKKDGKIHVTYSTNYSVEQVNKLQELQTKYVQGTGYDYNTGAFGKPTWYGPDAPSSPVLGGYIRQVSWGPAADTMYWDNNSDTVNYSSASLYDKHGRLVGQSSPFAKEKFVPYNNAAQFFRKGHTFDNSISITGGNDIAGFSMSISDMRQNGVVPNSTFNRNTAKLAGEAKISDRLSVSGSANYSKTGGSRVQQGSNISGVMLDLLRTPISFDNSNGFSNPKEDSAYVKADGTQRNYRGGGGYDNPYWTINRNPFTDDVNREFGYLQANYKVCDMFSLTYRLGNDIYSDRRKQGYDINSRAFPAGRVYTDQYFHRSFNSDLFGTLTKEINKDINTSLLIGNNMYDQYINRQYTQGDQLILPQFYDLSNSRAVTTSESLTRKRSMALYANGKIEYKNYLFVDLTARQEHVSFLPVGKRDFIYPSASAALVFTDALNMADNKYLPYGKVRVSYANVGSGGAFPYVTSTTFTQSQISDGFTDGIKYPFNGVGGFTRGDILGNPDLKPESTNTLEVGTDLRFIQNRISVDFTYYNATSTDVIIRAPIASSSGYPYKVVNSGVINNHGVEIGLGLTPIKNWNGLTWDMYFNYSKNISKVEKVGDGLDQLFLGGFEGSAIYVVKDQPYGVIYGGKWLRDGNGNVVINDDTTSLFYGFPVADSKNGVIGNPNPKWNMGITNTFTYKNLTFSALIDIKHGGQMWNGTEGVLNFFGTSKETEKRGTKTTFNSGAYSGAVYGHADADGKLVHYVYTSSGPTEVAGAGAANDKAVTLDENWYTDNGGGFGAVAEQFVQDASYVRLREMSLTYNLTSSILEQTKFIKGVTVGLYGRNLWLRTPYTGIDPDTNLMGASNAQGLEYFNNPGTKSMGVSLKVQF